MNAYRALASLVVLLMLGATARAEPPAPPKQPRTDLLGDPLPGPAIARLGTERLCLPGCSFLAFSADGKLLAGASYGELRLWEASTGKELWRAQLPRVISTIGSSLRPLGFSPDGKLLAMGDGGTAVHIWDVASGRENRRLECGGLMMCLAFSPDGKVLAMGGHASPIRLWDPAKGTSLGTWGQFLGISGISFSPDGKTVTAIVPDEKDGNRLNVSAWDAARGEERRRGPLERSPRWSGALSPDGALFAAPTPDGKAIRLVATRSNEEVARTEREADWPAGIAFSADGRRLAATSRDGVLRVWDAATGKLVRRVRGPESSVEHVALSPDGGMLAVVQRADQGVHLWDMARGRELHAFPGHRAGPLSVAFSGDGQAVLTASLDWIHSFPPRDWGSWSLRRWDAATGKELRVAARDLKGEVHVSAFSQDGSRLATLVHDGTLRLWDADTGRELREWKVPTSEVRINSGGGATTYSRAAVSNLTLTDDGKVLFARHARGIYRWETATGKELPLLKAPGENDWSGVLPSPDGRLVAVTAARSRGSRVLLDTSTGQKLHELATGGINAGPWGFSPDGRTLALVAGQELTLWEVASGRPRGRLALGGRFVSAMAFSPDGRYLALGGDEQAALQLWDLTSDRPAAGASWPGERASSLAFSPDGGRLAVAGGRNTALVYDVPALFQERPAGLLKLSADDRDRLWDDLAGADGGRAFRAAHRLAASGPHGVAFLEARLKAPPEVDPKRLARLIRELDDDAFETRESATRELERLGVRAEAALRGALRAGPSAEARTRLERLLGRLKSEGAGPPSPELVALRAVEALELSGGPEARAALERLARGRAADRLAAEAKASLARLARRAAKP